MKKTLVALAALSAFGAFAQSSVTISGNVGPSLEFSTITLGNGSSFSQVGMAQNRLSTSNFTLLGTEDLGGGMKAGFLIEQDVNVNANAGVTGGEAFGMIAGASWGSLKLGNPNAPTLTTQASRSPFGTKLGSGFGAVLGTGHVREAGSIRYDTPNWGGFSAALVYAPGTSVQPATAAAPSGVAAATVALPQADAKTDLGLFYANGPINAGLSFYNGPSTQGLVAAVNSKLTTLFGSYNFGVASVTLGYHTEDRTFVAGGAATSARGYNLAGTFSVSPSFLVRANFAQLKDDLLAPTNQDKRINAIGLVYSLSKRTNLVATYAVESNDNVGATAVSEVRTTSFGMSHSF